MIHLTEIIKNSRVSLFPSALNSGAHFSSLLINVLYGILFFSRIGHFFLHLKPVQASILSLNDFLNGIWRTHLLLLD